MAITQRTPTSGSVASSGSVNIVLPTGTTLDDIVIAIFANAGTAGPATPVGWNLVRATDSAGTGQSITAFWAPVTSTLTRAFVNAASVAALIVTTLTGARTENPIDLSAASNNTTNNTTLPTGAPVTGALPGDWELLYYCWTSAATITTIATGSTIDMTQANGTSVSAALGHNNTTSEGADVTPTAFSQTLSASNTRKTGVGVHIFAAPTPNIASSQGGYAWPNPVQRFM